MGRHLEVLSGTSFTGNIPTSGLCAFVSATTQSRSLFFELARHSHALSLKDVQLLSHRFEMKWWRNVQVLLCREHGHIPGRPFLASLGARALTPNNIKTCGFFGFCYFFFIECVHKTPVEIIIQFKCCARDEPRCFFFLKLHDTAGIVTASAHTAGCAGRAPESRGTESGTPVPSLAEEQMQKMHGICFSETTPKWVPGIDLLMCLF